MKFVVRTMGTLNAVNLLSFKASNLIVRLGANVILTGQTLISCGDIHFCILHSSDVKCAGFHLEIQKSEKRCPTPVLTFCGKQLITRIEHVKTLIYGRTSLPKRWNWDRKSDFDWLCQNWLTRFNQLESVWNARNQSDAASFPAFGAGCMMFLSEFWLVYWEWLARLYYFDSDFTAVC